MKKIVFGFLVPILLFAASHLLDLYSESRNFIYVSLFIFTLFLNIIILLKTERGRQRPIQTIFFAVLIYFLFLVLPRLLLPHADFYLIKLAKFLKNII